MLDSNDNEDFREIFPVMEWWKHFMTQEPHRVPMSTLFYDSVTQQPYEKCLLCEQTLKNKSYRVNKLFRKYPDFQFTETIMEMAICDSCATNSVFKISEASQKVILAFYAQVDFIQRLYDLYHGDGEHNYEPWIDTCLITHEPRNQISEYQIIAHISEDNHLILNEELFMISGKAIEHLSAQLSAETRQDLEDFTGKYFGIPPELLPQDNPKIVLF